MFRNLFVSFWADESGALVATEYLLLGSVVAVGSVTGMVEVRDSVNEEYKEFGQTVRETRQSYSVPTRRGGAASTGGTVVTDPAAPRGSNAADPLALRLPPPPAVTFSPPSSYPTP
jgi:Flp pilus assembly pilin Flp